MKQKTITLYDISHRGSGPRAEKGNKCCCLQARMGTGGNNVPILTGHTQKVRRLTVIECERLQGLPDNWTNIEFKGKPASDSKRYKAIGNGMAQPCVDFVMQRVVEAIINSKENKHE